MRTEQAHLIEEGLQHLVAHRVPVVDEVLAEEHLRQRVALRRVALEGLDHLRVDRQPEVVLRTHAQVPRHRHLLAGVLAVLEHRGVGVGGRRVEDRDPAALEVLLRKDLLLVHLHLRPDRHHHRARSAVDCRGRARAGVGAGVLLEQGTNRALDDLQLGVLHVARVEPHPVPPALLEQPAESCLASRGCAALLERAHPRQQRASALLRLRHCSAGPGDLEALSQVLVILLLLVLFLLGLL